MERKAFNFYRSYYDILQELPDADKLQFLLALIEMQFNETEPTNLTGLAKFAFISQRHSIIKQIEGYKAGINGGRPLGGGLKGANNQPQKGKSNQGQEKEKEKEEEEVKEKEEMSIFNEFRVLYQGTKRGLQTEFGVFKKHKDWKEVLPNLKSIIQNQIKVRNNKKAKNEFVPEWKNLQTWLNNRCWEEVTTISYNNPNANIKHITE